MKPGSAMPSRARHMSIRSGVASGWNCTPSALPRRKAWTGQAWELARRVAPAGSSATASSWHW